MTSHGLGRWLPIRGLTEKLVHAARQYNAFRENSHFYLTQAMTVFRTLFLQVGNRLVRRGLLGHEEEIMYLGYFEVKDLLYAIIQLPENQPPGNDGKNWRAQTASGTPP